MMQTISETLDILKYPIVVCDSIYSIAAKAAETICITEILRWQTTWSNQSLGPAMRLLCLLCVASLLTIATAVHIDKEESTLRVRLQQTCMHCKLLMSSGNTWLLMPLPCTYYIQNIRTWAFACIMHTLSKDAACPFLQSILQLVLSLLPKVWLWICEGMHRCKQSVQCWP